MNAQALARRIRVGKICRAPISVLVADQLDVGVAGFGNFGEAVFKGQAGEDGPKHDRERKRRDLGRGLGFGGFGGEL